MVTTVAGPGANAVLPSARGINAPMLRSDRADHVSDALGQSARAALRDGHAHEHYLRMIAREGNIL